MMAEMAAHDLAIPVRGAGLGGPYVGVDSAGRSCLYTVGEQHGSPLLLQIDPLAGVVAQFDTPPGLSGGRVAYWSDCWRSLFVFVHREDGVRLLRLDTATRSVQEIPLPGDHAFPVSISEAPDGTIYLGTCPTCSLLSYRPDTGKAADLGRLDETDQYLYVTCGRDGTVAAMVKMARPHVVVFDPATGRRQTVGPIADTDKGVGRVELFKATDGWLYIDSHEGVLQLNGFELKPVTRRPDLPTPTLPDGSTCRIIDGQRHGLSFRKLEIRPPTGERRVLELNYQAAGVEIYLVRAGIDGKVYGSSALPLHFFSYDPRSGCSIDHGASCTASGQTYSMDWLDGKLYFCVYTHGILGVYDPTRPWTFPQDEDQARAVAHTDLPLGHPRWPLRYGLPMQTNPFQLGRMDNVAYRPRDMVAGPAGKIWVVSVPDYGMWGGTLSWYDPNTDAFGGAHRHIVRDCSPVAITHIRDKNLLAIGFSIYPGSGVDPRAKYAGLALWDPVRDVEVWSGDLGLESIGFMDLEYAGEGLVYAISHPWPKEVLHSELVLLDLPSKRIVKRTRLETIAGWPLEVSFQRDERYLYGCTRQGVYRVPLGTVEIEMLWRDDKDGPTAGGALLYGNYYFATIERLRSVPIGR